MVKKFIIFSVVAGLALTIVFSVSQAKMTEIVLYGVQDSGGSPSQLFKLNLDSGEFVNLGKPHQQFNIEASAINPLTGQWYVIAGGSGREDGKLFLVNKMTGQFTFIGNTGATSSRKIQSASFHPAGVLWAAQEKVGLVTVDLVDGSLTVQLPLKNDWGGLAWNLAGTLLYAANDRQLVSYNPVSGEVTQVCADGFLPKKTEALEFTAKGELLGASDGSSHLFLVDPDNCQLEFLEQTLPYDDVESLAFDVQLKLKKPADLQLNMQKKAQSDRAFVGGLIHYTIPWEIVKGDLVDATLIDSLPQGLEYIAAQTSRGTVRYDEEARAVFWLLGTIKGGDEGIASLTVKVSEHPFFHPGAVISNVVRLEGFRSGQPLPEPFTAAAETSVE